MIVDDITRIGQGEIGGDVACTLRERTIPLDNAPDHDAHMQLGNRSRTQIPIAHGLKFQRAIAAVANRAGLKDALAI